MSSPTCRSSAGRPHGRRLLEDPRLRRGRRHVTRQGLDALTDFLRQAGVSIPAIERTWQALARAEFTSSRASP
jgi:hypothetical protein